MLNNWTNICCCFWGIEGKKKSFWDFLTFNWYQRIRQIVGGLFFQSNLTKRVWIYERAYYSSDILKRPQKFQTIFHLIWHFLSKHQIKWKLVSNFVAFLENLNFTHLQLWACTIYILWWCTIKNLFNAVCHFKSASHLVILL